MKKTKADSWKKLGMELAALPLEQHRHADGRPRTFELSYYSKDAAYRLSIRARALRKGANRGKA